MDFDKKWEEIIGSYFGDLLPRYQQTLTEATALGKKVSLFRKVDFSGVVQAFRDIRASVDVLQEQAEALEPETGGEQAVLYTKMKDALIRSLDDFSILCGRHGDFYEINDQKQYRKKQIKVKDFQFAWQGVQIGTENTAESLDLLERYDKRFHGEDVDIPELDEEDAAEADTAEDSSDEEEQEKAEAMGLNRMERVDERELVRRQRRQPHVYGKAAYDEEEEDGSSGDED